MIYSIVIEAAYGDEYIKANYLLTILQGSARTWLMNLPEGTVQSWDHLSQMFEANFHETYTRPGQEDDLFVMSLFEISSSGSATFATRSLS
jgi:hypothetical protein